MMRFERKVFSEFGPEGFTKNGADTRISSNHLKEMLECDKLREAYFKINEHVILFSIT